MENHFLEEKLRETSKRGGAAESVNGDKIRGKI